MNMRPRKREELDLNIAPLIDVVFLLLNFFMVTASFNRIADIAIDLPEASNDKKSALTEPIDITIDSAGIYYVNRKQLINTQIDTLKNALVDALKGRKEVPMIISADAKTPHQAVIRAMDAARQVGILHLSIATKQQQPP